MRTDEGRRASALRGLTAALAFAVACSSSEVIVAPIDTLPTNPTIASCETATPVTLAVGEQRTGLSGGLVCLRGDAASEFVVHAFFGSTVATAQTQVAITGTGITTAVTASPALGSVAPWITTLDGSSGPAQSLELGLRNYERNVLAPKMAAARATFRGGALRSVAPPPNVGDVIQLNASTAGCGTAFRFGRVAAVTNRAIVVSDTTNPTGGFSDAEYQSIGVTFDTLVDPLNQAAFGAPTDIDGNGRVIIFYTRVVNEMTPEGSEGVVQGFFHPRDLFPRTASGGLDGCNGSNVAEMFYMIVPDPNGTVNKNVRTKESIRQVTVSVIGHEYQHLINSARRIYVNDADDFEEVWLNEGLSHIAEELLFYRVSGLSPRSNLDGGAVTATQQRATAFNQYQLGNFGRYNTYLDRPETSSPYADNDSLENRGAIWSFLRYAADRAATTDGTIWERLVNAKTVGIPNLTSVFGTGIMDWFRDWSLSVYSDDKVATSTVFQQPSWNFRSIYPRLGEATFPLHVVKLSNGVQKSQILNGGSSLYWTFGVPASATASLAWTAPSSSVSISVLRVK